VGDPIRVDLETAKRDLRRDMRGLRLEVADLAASRQICDALAGLVDRSGSRTVMVYDAVAGEPDLSEFATWCDDRGIATITPDPTPTAVEPVDPASVDVVVVPGLAFAEDGGRLGQGGGWYDRFLARVRDECVTIGVCFDVQVVRDVPVAGHDVPVDLVVTEARVIRTSR
jgi:5-formyltetrahydrofolate cyclo-ligase